MNHYILHWSAALLLLCGSSVVTAQNNRLAVTNAELSGILSETLAELNLLQGVVIITDMDDNCVATAECRLAKHKSRPITRKFREAVESSYWRILKDTCEVDTSDLEQFFAWIFSSDKKLCYLTDLNRNNNETTNSWSIPDFLRDIQFTNSNTHYL